MAIKPEPKKNKNFLYALILVLVLCVGIISVCILRSILDMNNKTNIDNKVINESLNTQVITKEKPVIQTITKTEIKVVEKPVPVIVRDAMQNTNLKEILKGRIKPKDLFNAGFTPKELHKHGYYVKLLLFESKIKSHYDVNVLQDHINSTIKKIKDNEKDNESKVYIGNITEKTNRKLYNPSNKRFSNPFVPTISTFDTTIYVLITENPFKFDLKPFTIDDVSFKSFDFTPDLNTFKDSGVKFHDLLEIGFSKQDLINFMKQLPPEAGEENLTDKEYEERLQATLDDEIEED